MQCSVVLLRHYKKFPQKILLPLTKHLEEGRKTTIFELQRL